MKYLGKKSLSSFLYRFLQIAWYLVLALSIIALVVGVLVLFVVPPEQSCLLKKFKMSPEKIKNIPIIFKILIFPYFIVVAGLFLQILKKAQRLFNNLRKNVVFDTDNVSFLSKISKMFIAFSILTLSFSSLFISLFLLIICEIFKRGTALREENDLTI